MGTIADTPLVSNKVFQAMQPYQTIKEVTGTVVYANKYADVAEVPMPDWIRVILDSDAGTVGTNPLIQLKGKLEYLADGPWYVDSRNGMIYIHNKKFREDSIHTYVYQSENGEVIRVSFETQRVKHVDVAKALGIEPKSKELEKEKAATEQVKLTQTIRNKFIELNDATSTAGVKPKYIEERMKPFSSNAIEKDVARRRGRPDPETIGLNNAQKAYMDMAIINDQNDLLTPDQSADWQVRYHVSHQNKTLQGNKISEAVKNRLKYQESKAYDTRWKENNFGTTVSPNKQVRENEINQRTGKRLYDLTAELGHAVYQSKAKKEDPRPALKAIIEKYLGVGATHTWVAKVWKEEYVDPTTYSGNNTFTYNPRPISWASYSEPKPTINLAAKNGMEGMAKDPNIMILSELGMNPNKPRYFQVKILHLANHKTSVSLSKEFTDWALRQVGYDPSNGGWKQNKMANSSGSWEEKKLVVKMDVVGRPSLASSQILTLLNVGQRWSGNYYIKTCTHRMDAAEGYICSIELSHNRGKSGVHTKEDKVNTEKLVKDTAQGNNRNQSRGVKKVTTKAVTTTTRDYKKPQSTKRSKTSNNKRSNNYKSSKRK